MIENFDFGKYRFVNYLNLNEEQSELVLRERNHENVRKWMNNPEIILLKEHNDFIKTLLHSETKRYWMVYRNDISIGGAYITQIDLENSSGTWGYFLFDQYQGTGWGIDVEFLALSIFFNELGLKQVFGFVDKNNSNSLNIQPIFNFEKIKETESQFVFLLSFEKYSELPKQLLDFKLEKILKNGRN